MSINCLNECMRFFIKFINEDLILTRVINMVPLKFVLGGTILVSLSHHQ